jgi:2-C-methyl-D-erythritol 4-phosphate cytidylyltransferase
MGDTRNIKVTYPEDLALAELILRSRQPSAVSRQSSRKKDKTAKGGRTRKNRR